MKALYLYSNKTGLQSKFKKHGKIIKRLSKSFELDAHQTISVDDLLACCRDAKKNGYDAIIVCGGDGTLKDAVNAIAPLKKEERPIIGYIPMGTVNDSGKSFGVKGSIRQALKVIEKQHIYDIDICIANNEYWTFVAAIGQFTDISYIVPRKQKKILGRFAYYNVAVKEVFTKKRINVHIKCDQGEYDFETPFLMCLNGVNVGGFRVNPHNSLFDGKMNIYITPTTIFNGLTNYIFHRNKITIINTKHAEITTSETGSWCLDGEEGMKGNLVLDVLPAHIRVFGQFKNSR
ncbi:MAG: YegS/Rv2252/BmrU family lipid kinase [Bacilli bacterium]|nr:YegS/Rv2252/BmrU family lipid kinase [Bacilli bacterium]